MSDDRYRPPEADLTPGLRADGEPGRLDVSLAISDGWGAMVENFPLWLGIGVVALVLMAVSAATVIGVILLVPILAWGAVACLLAMFDEEGEFGQLFSGFSDYVGVLIVTIAWFILNVLISAVGQSVQILGSLAGNDALTVLGGLVSVAWGLTVTLRLSFAYYFVVDQGFGAVDAYRASWSYTRGQWISLVLLVLAGTLITLIGFAALVVGLIPANAMIAFMWTSAYRQLTGTR